MDEEMHLQLVQRNLMTTETTPKPEERLLLSRGEAAYLLSIPLRSLDKYIVEGRLASIRLGRHRLIKMDSVQRLLDETK